MNHSERLKELNTKSNRVVKEVIEAQEPGHAQATVAELANYAYVMGLEDARKELAKALKPVNAIVQREGL